MSWIELPLCSWLGTWGPNGDTISFIAKQEIKNLPQIGNISKAYQSIYVDRDNKTGRANTLQAIEKRVDLVKKGDSFGKVQIYCEGTRSNGQYLLK